VYVLDKHIGMTNVKYRINSNSHRTSKQHKNKNKVMCSSARHEGAWNNGRISPWILNYDTRWTWAVSFYIPTASPRESAMGSGWVALYTNPRAGLDISETSRTKIPPSSSRQPSHYTDYDIPAHSTYYINY